MSSPELPTPVCGEHLIALHRYAALLTGGDPAATATAFDTTVDRAASCAGDIRCPKRNARWLFAELRVQCRRLPRPVTAATVADGPAAAFARLPESERAALALFYVGPFRRLELAETLGVRPEELGPLLQRARTRLGEAESPAAAMVEAPTTPPADTLPDGALAATG